MHKKRTQNRTYKCAAPVAWFFGAVVGFGPSYVLIARHGKVWDVFGLKEHGAVDVWLKAHVVLAAVWAVTVMAQFATGGLKSWFWGKTFHRVCG